MNIARRLGGALLAAVAIALLPTVATAADAPVIESVVDRESGTVLWSMANPTAQPLLKPGQAILLKGRNFGQGALTTARPGVGPPAGGGSPGGRRCHSGSPPVGPRG